MKRFEFSLQKVLEIKESEKKLIQRELTSLLHQYEAVSKEYELIAFKIRDKKNVIENMNKRKFSSTEYMQLHNFIESLQEEQTRLKKKIQQLDNAIDDVRKLLKEKLKEEKSLGILKEKRFNEHKKLVKKKEQEFNDEISIIRNNRKVENE